MSEFSESILGKFCAVILIAYYTTQNIIYGLLFCIVVIYYYQVYYFTSLKICNGTPFGPTTRDSVSINQPGSLLENFVSPLDESQKLAKIYPERNGEESDFIRRYCDGDQLKYKDLIVNPEMTEHVFPEVKTHSVCNPCNPMCKFSISNNKLRTEEELVIPKESNQWMGVWGEIQK
jgi:hypothetical protein